MAKGRTISATCLTDKDRQIIELCGKIAQTIKDEILNEDDQKVFLNEFGKIHFTRDSGLGRGAGKLQRDALCTSGIQGNAPFSNRNLRWHPLVVATNPVSYAKPIERIEIEADESLIFVVKENGIEKSYPSEQIYLLTQRYVTLPEHWQPHYNILRNWGDTEWTQNSCLITAYEACDWQDAVEAYAVLGLSIAVDNYKIEFNKIFSKTTEILKNQRIDNSIKLPTNNFPTEKNDIICCPLCKIPKSENPAKLPDRIREDRYKFDFSGNKRGEGDDSSMQIMHIKPLEEVQLSHNAANVRFGHRWCNVAMTDHSIEETVDFMEYIVKAHNRK
jgi:hypothetical protein